LEEAEDLTQTFFAQLLSKNYLASADRERGRFRTFLLGSMNHFLANQWNRDRAQKRGGHCEFISLEQVADPGGLVPDPAHYWTPERLYERRWAETVLANVLDRLRAEFDGATVKRFEVLKSFLTDFRGTVSYQEAARLLGMTESAIKSAINRLRQRWRELMREEIAQTLQVVTEKEVDEEIRYLIEVLE
jgi:RNA polymerase sigma-70 factor (ECF subfamily)